jgi:hypothetical protein
MKASLRQSPVEPADAPPPTCSIARPSLDKVGTLIVQSGIAQNHRPRATSAIDGLDIESAFWSHPKALGPGGARACVLRPGRPVGQAHGCGSTAPS